METKVFRGRSEDVFTSAIEAQTSKIPSSVFLGLALGSIAASAALKAVGEDEWSAFAGQWAAPFLLLGLYNKVVKQLGSDAYSREAA
jgi:hypothetical protein